MRTVSGAARAIALDPIVIRAVARHPAAYAIAVGLLAGAFGAEAQNYGNGHNPYYLNNQTYSYGLHLPQVPQPNGQDEIRAADGTTCRSSMASNNAYLDMGGIGGQGQDGSFDSGTVYGRLIVPLGGVPDRLDCSSLYNLEIERLKYELALVRSGAAGGAFVPSAAAGSKDKGWAERGWSNAGWKAGATSGGKSAAAAAEAAADNLPKATVVPMRLQPIGAINGVSPPDRAAPEGVEVLPWSNVPAQPARVLVGIPSKPKRAAEPDISPQQLVR